MVRYFIALLLLIWCLPVSAQKRVSDSLENLLKKNLHDTARIDNLLQLAKLYQGKDGDRSWKYASEALELSSKIANQRRIGLSYNALGNVFLLFRGAPDSALVQYRKVYDIAQKTGDKYLEGFALNNFGNVAKIQGDIYKAQSCFEQAIKLRREAGDSSGMAGSMSNLGAIMQQKGDMKKALDLYYAALPIKQRENNPEALATTYENIGLLHLDRKEPLLAMEMLQKAEKIYEYTGNQVRMSRLINSIAIAYYDQQKFDSALTEYNRSLEIRLALNDSDGIAECYTNIGNVHYTRYDYQSALRYYRLAMAFIPRNIQETEVAVYCNFAIGLAYAGKKDSALIVAQMADEMADHIGTPDQKIAVYGAYSDIYKASGEYEKALDYFMRYVGLRDSLFRNQSAREINELDALYRKSEQDREINDLKIGQELLQKDQERKDIILYAAAGGIVLLLLVVGLVVNTNRQRKRANLRLEDQNRIIAEKNKDITDSILYARRIQQSVLPDEKLIAQSVKEYFILNKPRDIVSGDFFWLARKENRFYVAVADCTGHGVPGALVSVVGLNMLNKIMEQGNAKTPSLILDQLHELVINALNKDSSSRETKDGMDIGLLCIDQAAGKAWFAGAGRPLYYSPEPGTIELIRGERNSIAGEKTIGSEPFTQTEIPLKPGAAFYLSSDGYADQFGEASRKKFLAKRFQEFIASVSALPMNTQREKIDANFENWKGKLEQVDDVLVIGVRI